MAWDRNQINQMLLTRNDAVERGIVQLFKLQTADEQQVGDTKHHNNVGFNSSSTKAGSYYAQWVLSGRHLTGKHLDNARKIAIKHSRQLVEIANAKLAN